MLIKNHNPKLKWHFMEDKELYHNFILNEQNTFAVSLFRYVFVQFKTKENFFFN